MTACLQGHAGVRGSVKKCSLGNKGSQLTLPCRLPCNPGLLPLSGTGNACCQYRNNTAAQGRTLCSGKCKAKHGFIETPRHPVSEVSTIQNICSITHPLESTSTHIVKAPFADAAASFLHLDPPALGVRNACIVRGSVSLRQVSLTGYGIP